MKVGSGVGSGVFSSMVGGWSPKTGDSSVGRVENIPGGAAGEPTGSSLESPQASRASRARETAAVPRNAIDDFRRKFASNIT